MISEQKIVGFGPSLGRNTNRSLVNKKTALLLARTCSFVTSDVRVTCVHKSKKMMNTQVHTYLNESANTYIPGRRKERELLFRQKMSGGKGNFELLKWSYL
jgi:hypothetical protein